MNTRNKLENKLYKYTIPNLYLVIIVCFVIGYIIRYLIPSLYDYLLLIPYMIVVRHQFWRLFTWILTVPYEFGGSFLSLLFLPISLYFYYYLGRNLESYWGRFMYNLYIFGGAILTDILVVLGGIYYYYISPNATLHMNQFPQEVAMYGDSVSAGLSVTRFMLISIFLAFTVVGGDHVVYLYFLIPIKMKWLAYVDLALMAYYFLAGGLFTKIVVFSSIANYFVYAYINRSRTKPTFKDRKRQKEFIKAKQKGYKARRRHASQKNGDVINFPGGSIIPPGTGNPDGITVHKCAVCGRTEVDSPNLEFRFCSKCNGNYEYCSEHLYTHQHIE